MDTNHLKKQPELSTGRLILRRFTEQDAQALLEILSDREVNTFLPWFPLETLAEAQEFLRIRYLEEYQNASGWHYAVCLKTDGVPIGYLNVSGGESHDFGYGFKREFWGRGIATESGRAVIALLRQAGLDYITATHDVKNPASGAVMRKLGMTYRYSYEELWQPKNIPVTFRMYQLNLDGEDGRVYREYWDRYPIHFVEDQL